MSTPLNKLPKAKRLNVNGVYVAPQQLTCGIMDVDYEAGRTADGKMHRNKVATKRKVSVTMPPCATSVIQPLLAAMDHASFTVTVPDPREPGGSYTGTFYVGDRTVPIYNYALDIWNGLTFDLVEI